MSTERKTLEERAQMSDIARLRHEHAVLSRFDDDGILRTLDFVTSGSRAALVLEDFDGASLREYIPPEGLSVASFLGLAPRIVRALAVVHAAGVLHKDIKPDNIIADPDLRRVALADFSIASVTSVVDWFLAGTNAARGGGARVRAYGARR